MNASTSSKTTKAAELEKRTGRKFAALLVALHAAGAKLGPKRLFNWTPPIGVNDATVRERDSGKVVILYTWSPPAGATGTDINMQVRELRERSGSFYVTMPGRMGSAKVPGDYEWNVGPEKFKALRCYLDDITLRLSKLVQAPAVQA
jgi:peptidoglycan/xylan/chitin deacetylase (PgdA/CDA1 family)